MNSHISDVFTDRIREVRYLEASFVTIEDMGETPAERLEAMVNEAIAEGWEPVGTPVYEGRDSEMPGLIQIMARRHSG